MFESHSGTCLGYLGQLQTADIEKLEKMIENQRYIKEKPILQIYVVTKPKWHVLGIISSPFIIISQ